MEIFKDKKDKKYEDMSYLEFITDVLGINPTKEQIKLIEMFEELKEKGNKNDVVYHFPSRPNLNDVIYRGGTLDIDTIKCPSILC